jgi:hypothetical protein
VEIVRIILSKNQFIIYYNMITTRSKQKPTEQPNNSAEKRETADFSVHRSGKSNDINKSPEFTTNIHYTRNNKRQQQQQQQQQNESATTTQKNDIQEEKERRRAQKKIQREEKKKNIAEAELVRENERADQMLRDNKRAADIAHQREEANKKIRKDLFDAHFSNERKIAVDRNRKIHQNMEGGDWGCQSGFCEHRKKECILFIDVPDVNKIRWLIEFISGH